MAIMPPMPPFSMESWPGRVPECDAPHAPSAIDRLYGHLRAHEREETDTLAEYQHVADTTSDAGVRLIMNLVLQDERRHHQLMKAMADEVDRSLQWVSGSGASPLPAVNAEGEERDRLLVQIRHFLDMERTGLRRLDELHTEVNGLHAGLPELILQLMAMDTRKHIEILGHLARQLAIR